MKSTKHHFVKTNLTVQPKNLIHKKMDQIQQTEKWITVSVIQYSAEIIVLNSPAPPPHFL